MFWFQPSVVYVEPSTPIIWRTTTQASALLEISTMAPIIEFFLQLVAIEWFLVELMTIKKKVHRWAHVQSDMIERTDLLCAVFGKTSDVSTFKIFVAVRSFTADVGLLQPTESVNTTPQKTRFRSVNSYKEFTYTWKVNMREQWQQLNQWHEVQSEIQQCVKWPETMEHRVSVVDANAFVVMHCRSFVFRSLSYFASYCHRLLTVFLV